MRRILFGLTILAAAGAGTAAGAQTLRADYAVTLAGLPLGTADLSSTFEGPRYTMQFAVKLTGLARMLTGGKGAATASGSILGPQPQPTAFAVTSRSSSAERTVRMGLSAGNVAALDVNPPVDEKADRVAIKEADKRGIVDPLSALLMPVAGGRGPTDPANCGRTLPVFDGAARFNVVLSYGETRSVDIPGYRGPVLVCNARYVPISGHRALRPATKFMEENKDMSVWLAPVAGQKVLVPVRIAVRTMVGMSVVEASNWSLDPAPAVTPISTGRASRPE
ncbi:MAG: DUF3108 domain-containing protein [Microvirga sp.]